MEKAIKKCIVSILLGGRRWQIALCVLLTINVALYVCLHYYYETSGREKVQLNQIQLNTLNKFVANYPDDTGSIKKNDSAINAIRLERNDILCKYLQHEYDNAIDSGDLVAIKQILLKTNSKDCLDYFTHAKIIIESPFWLTSHRVYYEVGFWSFFGVLVSLIYYVSRANSSKSKSAGSDDSGGSFDPNEVMGQIAKMFYAPACTIILVLGYHFITDKNNNMVEISVNKGVLVFSFIAGFYSGRVMKFLDKLKTVLLPDINSDSTNTTTNASDNNLPNTGSLELSIGLSDAVKQTTDAPDIIEAGFNAAHASLTSITDGKSFELTNPEDDQAETFKIDNIPTGKYKLVVAMAHKKTDETIMNLGAQNEVEITKGANSLAVELNIVQEVG